MDRLVPGEGGRDNFASPIGRMMDEERGLPSNAEAPTPRPRNVGVVPKGKFRFRTRAEALRKRFEIPLLIPHVGKDDPEFPAAYARYRNWAERQIAQGRIPEDEFTGKTGNTPRMLKRDRAVFEVIHEYKLKFQPIRKSRECVYTTDNPIVADYIRWRISLGHFDIVTEDLRPLMIRIGDQEFPAQILDDEGQRALAKLMATGVDIDSLVVQGALDGNGS